MQQLMRVHQSSVIGPTVWWVVCGGWCVVGGGGLVVPAPFPFSPGQALLGSDLHQVLHPKKDDEAKKPIGEGKDEEKKDE